MPININNIISSETLARDFGRNSSIYKFFIEKSRVLWMKVKNNENIMKKYKSWMDSIRNVYGVYPGEELFFTHTYLSIITKLILFFILEENTSVSDEEITSVINGSYFRSHGILNFTDEDFSTWLLDNRIINDSLELIRQLAQRLSNYEYNNVKEDIFKEIYEELIERGERRKAGEYYTPEWLAQLVILEVMDLWLERRSYPPLIMDPACGSGTFLYNAIRILIERFPSISLNEILGRVIGIDINPIAAMIAKANYIIALKDLIKKGVSISIPVYRGDALKQHVKVNADVIVGNPPWVVLRNIKDESYQDYLKREVLRYGLISREDVHLYTQIELAALFFYKCSDVCLKDNGIIGFVMPRSVIGGTVHHVNFRRFRNPPMKLVKILDLENVYPLFNMPSCVLIAVKGGETRYPVLRVIYHGTLPKRNVSWEEARRFLRVSQDLYFPPEIPARKSYYFDKFKVGASIFPRTLYFIDVVSSKNSLLSVRTSKEILEIVKPPWRVVLEGEVEPDFIYLTLLAWDIVPFGCRRLRPVILPIRPARGRYLLYDYHELRRLGYPGASEWFEKAQRIWEERRTERSAKRFPRLIDRLNYNGLLTAQNPDKRYVVLYNATGKNLVSCVVDRRRLPSTGFPVRGFVADVKTWFYETNNDEEAYYLSAVLNSSIVNELIKPFQPRGLFGARAIHRRPLYFPIPKFNEENRVHAELAELGRISQEKVVSLLRAGSEASNTRRYVRERLRGELRRVDSLVAELLNMSELAKLY